MADQITIGELVGTLREIACAAPAFDGQRFEDFPAFAARLKLTARETVLKFDAHVAELWEKKPPAGA